MTNRRISPVGRPHCRTSRLAMWPIALLISPAAAALAAGAVGLWWYQAQSNRAGVLLPAAVMLLLSGGWQARVLLSAARSKRLLAWSQQLEWGATVRRLLVGTLVCYILAALLGP